ncbi:urease accessory protein D-like [Spinacia oleracea]|uniref:Urease accessory protein D-like n=1 Tax=Spinacia oleracea TaxID=3562 RepID=A0ABM3QZ47_SPIOL|nr:urease accessory protein D-like [Spinacia oleracea]XP_056693957.1 urease accessory protein D-like [Spinacia oleracea]
MFFHERYAQNQASKVQSDSNLLVDWFTSGRYESEERWNFELCRSENNFFYEDGQPLFLYMGSKDVSHYCGSCRKGCFHVLISCSLVTFRSCDSSSSCMIERR